MKLIYISFLLLSLTTHTFAEVDLDNSDFSIASKAEQAGNLDLARIYYKKVIQDKKASNDTLQIAEFNYTKISLKLLRDQYPEKEEFKKYATNLIFPLLDHAITLNKDSKVAQEISTLNNSLRIELNMDPTILPDGNKFVSKNSSGHIAAKLRFDDQVQVPSAENNLVITPNSSLVYLSEASFNAEDLFFNRWSPGFNLSGDYSQYTNKKSSEVFQNDSAGFGIKFKNDLFFKVKNQNLKVKLDWNVKKEYIDYLKIHRLRSFSTKSIYTLGFNYSYFLSGDSSLDISSGEYNTEIKSYNTNYTELVFSQGIFLKYGKLAKISFRYKDLSEQKLKLLSLKALYFVPSFFKKFNFTGQFEIGTEEGTFYISSIEMSKEIYKNVNLVFDMNYWKVISNSPELNSHKLTLGTSLKYFF